MTTAPAWTISLALLGAGLAAALAVHEGVVRWAASRPRRRGAAMRAFLTRTRSPARMALMLAAVALAVGVAPLSTQLTGVVRHVLGAAVIVLLGWAAMMAVDVGSALYIRQFRTGETDSLHARKLLTQTRILRRLTNVAVQVVTVALVLMTIPGVRQLGVSLLAAGGAAGIIVGLALQPVLSNMIAGIQIAFTQPIRIDDAVVVQGEFGYVEEIKSTYVVIRLADLRRMIVPLKVFLEQPFQNWSRDNARLVISVDLFIDPAAPIAPLRAEVERIVRAAPLWAGETCRVQLDEIREQALRLRCMMSARNAAEAAELRATVREAAMDWIQANPGYLPRARQLSLDGPAAEDPSASGSGPGNQRVQQEQL